MTRTLFFFFPGCTASHVDLSPLTGDETHVSCSGSVESYPGHCQRTVCTHLQKPVCSPLTYRHVLIFMMFFPE